MSFILRPARAEDAREIAEIHYAGWRNAYGSVVPPEQMAKKQPEKRVPFWQERIARADEIVLVAHDDAGRMQGFIHGGPVLPHDITSGSLAGFDCEIYVLHCRKETQGKGLGRQLIAAAAREFQRRSKTALVLWAYTDNAYRPFYDKLGGVVVAEGIDEGVADVAYGWRSLNHFIAEVQNSKTGARPMEKA
jgi:GNAT superfamily N-acetyltransferase